MQMTDSPASKYFFPGDFFIWNLLKWTAPTDCQPGLEDVPWPAAGPRFELRTLRVVLGTGDPGAWRTDRGFGFDGIVDVVVVVGVVVVGRSADSLAADWKSRKKFVLSFWSDSEFFSRFFRTKWIETGSLEVWRQPGSNFWKGFRLRKIITAGCGDDRFETPFRSYLHRKRNKIGVESGGEQPRPPLPVHLFAAVSNVEWVVQICKGFAQVVVDGWVSGGGGGGRFRQFFFEGVALMFFHLLWHKKKFHHYVVKSRKILCKGKFLCQNRLRKLRDALEEKKWQGKSTSHEMNGALGSETERERERERERVMWEDGLILSKIRRSKWIGEMKAWAEVWSLRRHFSSSWQKKLFFIIKKGHVTTEAKRSFKKLDFFAKRLFAPKLDPSRSSAAAAAARFQKRKLEILKINFAKRIWMAQNTQYFRRYFHFLTKMIEPNCFDELSAVWVNEEGF